MGRNPDLDELLGIRLRLERLVSKRLEEGLTYGEAAEYDELADREVQLLKLRRGGRVRHRPPAAEV